MKNPYSKYIIPSVIIFFGALMMIIGFNSGAVKDYKDSLKITDMEAVLPSADITNLNIEIDEAAFDIKASNEVKDLMINAENISKNNLDYSINNGTLHLRYSIKKWYNYADMIGLMKSKGKITLLVPADVDIMDIQIATGLSKSNISYLTAERIYIECGSGNVNIKNLTADHIEINGGKCQASCCNITGKTSDLICGSGKLSVSNIEADDIGLSCGSGDIDLSGRINGNSIISCKSGSVLMDIYNDADNFKFKTDGRDIKINGKKTPPKSKGKKIMDIKCGLGEINIDFK